MSEPRPPPSTPNSTPNKFRKLKHVPQDTPKKKAPNGTVVHLEYNKNPSTGELTDNLRLTVVLKQGTKNPKGLVERAWNGANLREKWWFVLSIAQQRRYSSSRRTTTTTGCRTLCKNIRFL